MDQILINIRNTFAFIDDFLIVTKGRKEYRMAKVEGVQKILEEACIRLKLEKRRIAQAKPNGSETRYRNVESNLSMRKVDIRPTTP